MSAQAAGHSRPLVTRMPTFEVPLLAGDLGVSTSYPL